MNEMVTFANPGGLRGHSLPSQKRSKVDLIISEICANVVRGVGWVIFIRFHKVNYETVLVLTDFSRLRERILWLFKWGVGFLHINNAACLACSVRACSRYGGRASREGRAGTLLTGGKIILLETPFTGTKTSASWSDSGLASTLYTIHLSDASFR